MIPNLSKVKTYTDKQLIERVKSLNCYKGIPKDYWILGVQSHEDTFDEFDDKFYLFKGEKFVMVMPGTTNAGTTGLKNYNRYNSKGCAVIKTNEWYYDLWKPGYHKGKMPALVQNKPILYYRDWNKNNRVEEMGELYKGMIGINFHTVLYSKQLSFWRKFIGGWSVGCQVVNHIGDYYKCLDLIGNQSTISYCLIKEF